MHFPKNGRHFDGHFGFYIDYYRSETFWMLNKTFVDNFIGLSQEIVLCRCLKRFFSILSRPSWNYKLATIVTLKRQIRGENKPGITYR